MTTRLVLLVSILFSSFATFAQVKFSSPLKGTAGQDYWIVNYVDHDATTGLMDNSCGNKTYDGHEGTDFLIRSFKTMDSGVVVYAMADGIVFKTKDSLFDRSKQKNNGGLGNYVAVNHGGEYWAYYAHFKSLSLLVKVGDTVKEGQALGLIGSSGNSTDPHLHLEVYDINSNIVDPYAGACQTSTPTVWKSQQVYDTTLRVIDHGFTAYVPDLDTLRERYDIRDTVYTLTDTAINFWAQLQGVRKGDTQRVDWYTPSGTFWFTYSINTAADYWYYYTWTYINMPHDSLAGRWNARYYINNNLVLNTYVQVVASVGVEEISKEQNQFTIYPNPTKGSVFIRSNIDAPLELYDIYGKLLGQYPASTNSLSISHLQSGVYLLKQGNVVQRVIKQ